MSRRCRFYKSFAISWPLARSTSRTEAWAGTSNVAPLRTRHILNGWLFDHARSFVRTEILKVNGSRRPVTGHVPNRLPINSRGPQQ